SLVQQAAHEDANIIFGLVTDPDMGEIVKVTVIATGFDVAATAAAHHEPAVHVVPVARQSRPSMSVAAPAPRRSSLAPSFARPSEQRVGRRSMPEQVALPEARAAGRAFGASALHDEAVLDIPAYLRRGASHE